MTVSLSLATGNDKENDVDFPSVVDVLTQYLLHNSVQTKVAVLRWIHHLYTKLPEEVSPAARTFVGQQIIHARPDR